MTSRISLINLQKENMRRRPAALIISILAAILGIVGGLLFIQEQLYYVKGSAVKEIKSSLTLAFAPNSYVIPFVIAFILGTFLAMEGFSYLHSKSQEDLFEALPVKRSRRFWAVMVNSILMGLIPVIISELVPLIYVISQGIIGKSLLVNALMNMAFALEIYLSTLMVAVLAMVVTGHLFIAALGYGVFMLYLPVCIRLLFPALAQEFFATYVYDSTSAFADWMNYLSPVGQMTQLTNVSTEAYTWAAGEHYPDLLWFAIFILVILAADLHIYKMRTAQSAGKAIAFEWMKPIIRMGLVIPLAVYLGIFVEAMAYTWKDLWLFVGLIAAALIIHGFMESVFEFDIKACLNHKIQLLCCIAVACAIVGIARWDLFGYDTWIPEEDQIAGINLDIDSEVQSAYSYWGSRQDGITSHQAEALDLVKSCLKTHNLVSREYSDEINEGSWDTSITVTYTMANGAKRARYYYVKADDILPELDAIYATEDYKNDCQSLYTSDHSLVTNLNISDGICSDTMHLTEEEKTQLFDTYLSELSQLTYSDTLNNPVVCDINLTHSSAEYGDDYEDLYIYSSFTKTIALLQDFGYSVGRPLTLDYQGLSGSVTMYDDDYNVLGSYDLDADTVNELLPELLVPCAGYSRYQTDGRYEVYVDLERDGVTYSTWLQVSKDKGEEIFASLL